jgi:hypothetical protein
MLFATNHCDRWEYEKPARIKGWLVFMVREKYIQWSLSKYTHFAVITQLKDKYQPN